MTGQQYSQQPQQAGITSGVSTCSEHSHCANIWYDPRDWVQLDNKAITYY